MEGCPKLLNLIPKDEEWHVRETEGSQGVSEEKKLELRLGPPGEAQFIKQDTISSHTQIIRSLLSASQYSSNIHTNNFHGVFQDKDEAKTNERNWLTNSTEFQCQKLAYTEERMKRVIPSTWSYGPLPSSKPCGTGVAELQYPEKRAYSTPAKPAVQNISHKRNAPAPVVGWPPIRSFRKNLAHGSSQKLASESANDVSKEVTPKKNECFGNGMFVKINMDGVPIGRKVDLKAYDSYDKLSSAVDKLFRDLLAAQRDTSAAEIKNKMEETTITGLLDGSGEYTLVYEDNEGDRMLVGDVPWHMFIATVKRLRVLKSSELSSLHLACRTQEKTLPSGMELGK